MDAERFLERVREWAAGRPDVRAVGLAGSRARGTARADSDVDLVVLTHDVAAYIEADGWAYELGATGIVRMRSWGAVTERRFALPEGIEVDCAVGEPTWARTEPLDPGTKRVVSEGFRVVYDPDGLLAALVRASRAASPDPTRSG